MHVLSNRMSVMDTKTRPQRTPLENRRQTILAFRWLIALTSLLLMIYGAKGLELTRGEYFFVAFLVGSNLALTLAPRRLFTRTGFIASVFGMDIVLLFLVIHLSGGAGAELYALYFLVVFLALPARSIPVSVMVAFFASLLYGVVTYRASGVPGLLQTSFLIKIPFFFAVAVFGNLISREARALRRQKEESKELTEQLRRNLETATESKDRLNDHLLVMQNYNEGIVSSIESGVIVVDLGGTITAFNPAAEEITGVRRDDVFLKKSNTSKTLQAICSFMQQGKEKPARHQELIMQTASGESKTLGISVYPLKHKKERVVGTVGIFTDLTEMNKLREKVRESEKLSIQQEMAARFVHDLKKPLSSIQRLSELILSEGENMEKRNRYAAAISKGVVGIVTTIREMPTLSKDTKPERKLLDVNALVKEVVDSMEMHAKKSGASVAWNPGEGFPRITGDREQLKKMFFNLVLNSIQAVETQGEIQVSTSKTGEGVSVEIEGNGPNITKRTQAKRFNPFLPTKAREAGVGLAIARKIVENHGGTIDLHDEIDRGTKFTVCLPASQPTSLPMSQLKPDAPLPPIERQTVLMADLETNPKH